MLSVEKKQESWAKFEPGMLVRHPDRADWGVGQVQSAIGNMVTVNFEHSGKVVVNLSNTTLIQVYGL